MKLPIKIYEVTVMLKAGASQICMTPWFNTPIPGYFTARYSTGIKDDLYARAVVLDDGKMTVALISMDIIAVSEDMADTIRTRAYELTAIPCENIMIAATHTHTGSPIDMSLYYCEPDHEVVEFVCRKAADAVLAAFNRLEPAKLGFGRGEEDEVGFNRRFIMKDGSVRTNPGICHPDLVKRAGPIDPELGVVRIDKEDGSPLAVLVNYACHPDVVGGNEFCADYPGELSRTVQAQLGNIPVLFFNGCCGNINHIDFFGQHPFDKDTHYKKMGRILGGKVLSVREKIYTSDEAPLAVVSRTLTGKRRQPTDENIAWAKEYLAGDIPSVSEKAYAEAYLDLKENPIYEKSYELQAIRIGDIAISALPSETFVEIGLAIKEGSPFENNFVVELANGCLGYVSTPAALAQQGGYETRLSKYTYMDENTAGQIAENAVAMLKELK